MAKLVTGSQSQRLAAGLNLVSLVLRLINVRDTLPVACLACLPVLALEPAHTEKGAHCRLSAGAQGPQRSGLTSYQLRYHLKDRYENLFQAPQGDAMILVMWQDDLLGVAWFIDACSERVYTSAGPPVGDQASDQP